MYYVRHYEWVAFTRNVDYKNFILSLSLSLIIARHRGIGASSLAASVSNRKDGETRYVFGNMFDSREETFPLTQYADSNARMDAHRS